jgi:hypothetical protein
VMPVQKHRVPSSMDGSTDRSRRLNEFFLWPLFVRLGVDSAYSIPDWTIALRHHIVAVLVALVCDIEYRLSNHLPFSST